MIELRECLTLSESRVRVDRERGILFDVKVLGYRSSNGRQYDPAGIDPKLYEGRKVCIDHVKPGQSRSSRDTVGWLEGVTKEKTGIYAERLRLLNPRGEFEQKLLTAAEAAPHVYGLSHTARGREKPGSHGAWIEAVESVETVDLVDDPASVSSLHESKRGGAVKTLSEWCADLEASRPLYVKALREMAEAGVMSPDTAMDAPADEAGGGEADHEAALNAGFEAAVMAIFRDESMDMKAKVKKFRAVLKAQEKLLGMPDGGGGGGADDGPPTEESRRRREAEAELGRYRSRDRVRAAADEARVVIPKALLESLAPDLTEAQAKALVNEIKGTAARPGARSTAPLPPAKRGGGRRVTESTEAPPSDPRQVGRWLNGR